MCTGRWWFRNIKITAENKTAAVVFVYQALHYTSNRQKFIIILCRTVIKKHIHTSNNYIAAGFQLTSIGRLMDRHRIHYHKYADDTQLYTSLSVPASLSLDNLTCCTTKLQHRYWANDLRWTRRSLRRRSLEPDSGSSALRSAFFNNGVM